jgi:hypothetical protein
LLKALKDRGAKYISTDIEGRDYDVFISYKSEDYEYAKVVYDFLQSSGLKVFFSKESLPILGSAEYHKQIDLAIEHSHHMVVVATSGDHVRSKWVEYEWRLFYKEILDGRKKGNLVSVLAEGMVASELPILLRNLEAIPLVPMEIEKLLKYVHPVIEHDNNSSIQG